MSVSRRGFIGMGAVAEGAAVMRIVFQPADEGGVRIKGFGHRFRPADIYHRLVLGER